MSNFRILLEKLLDEYDRDDPTDNFWKAAKDNKNISVPKRQDLVIKPINSVKQEDLVFIKQVTVDTETGEITGTRWLSNSAKPYGRAFDRNNAQKYTLSQAQKWVDAHPRQKIQDRYEIHYEIESVNKV